MLFEKKFEIEPLIFQLNQHINDYKLRTEIYVTFCSFLEFPDARYSRMKKMTLGQISGLQFKTIWNKMLKRDLQGFPFLW